MLVVGPFSGVSTVAAPVVTSMRRFWPALLVTRRRSGTGLKSTPNAVPDKAAPLISEAKVAAKFFIHNESLDFCCAARAYIMESTLGAMLSDLILAEIQSSRLLEAAAFEKSQWRLFRTDVVVDPPPVRMDF